jgi:hypothetical protein
LKKYCTTVLPLLECGAANGRGFTLISQSK